MHLGPLVLAGTDPRTVPILDSLLPVRQPVVLGGRSIEKLSKILGHYSIVQTEVYAHLRPDLFSAEDLAGLPVSLRNGPDSVP
jgi:hypothetical protein